jgi:hypothetical protein
MKLYLVNGCWSNAGGPPRHVESWPNRLIGKLLMFATFRGASQDQPADPRHKKRQERLIRATPAPGFGIVQWRSHAL